MFQKTAAVDRTFPALGTLNNIRIFDPGSDGAAQRACERVESIENRMSAFRPASDICELARLAGTAPRRLHTDTFAVLRKALRYGELSGGAFDATVRPLTELWGINKKGSFVPSDAEIAQALQLVDYRTVHLDERTESAFLERPGQALDLGGIAKGYAADEVRRILLENGVGSAMVNLGGNIMAVGARPDGGPWRIGIQNPLAPTGEFLGVLSVADKTVVTSGCNERFFIKDCVRYHHILDPRTGRPVCNSLLSVTAVCQSSADADALTTALFVLSPEDGFPLLKQAHAEAISIFQDLSIAVTNGLRNAFRPVRQEKAGIV